MISREKIKDIALQEGFKLKEQPSGELDLNPYVYGFANRLVNQHSKISVIDDYCTELSEFTRKIFGSEFHTQLMMILLMHRMSYTVKTSEASIMNLENLENAKSMYMQRLEDNVDHFLETLEDDPVNAMTSSFFLAQNMDIHQQFLAELGFEMTTEGLDALLKLMHK